MPRESERADEVIAALDVLEKSALFPGEIALLRGYIEALEDVLGAYVESYGILEEFEDDGT